MIKGLPNSTIDSDALISSAVQSGNAEFLGSFQREDGRVCDYYVVSNESGTFYFYVPRIDDVKE